MIGIGKYVNQIKGQDEAGFWNHNDENWAIWAIDGAYPLIENDSSAKVEELSKNLSQCLHNEFENNGIRDIRTSLQSALSSLNSLEKNNSTATLTLATSNGEILTLGDSESLIENGNKRIIAPDFRGVESKILNKIEKLIIEGVDPEIAYFSVKDELIDRRNRRNEIENSSGWIIANKNINIIHQYAHVENFNQNSNICVFTDGISRLIDWRIVNNVFNIVKQDSIDESVRELRSIEQSDCLKLEKIRFSVSDDASIAWKIQNTN